MLQRKMAAVVVVVVDQYVFSATAERFRSRLSVEITYMSLAHKNNPTSAVASVVAEGSSDPHPSLGIDIDGCVDEAPLFFQLLTRCWPGRVIVISFRSDRPKAEACLAQYKIRYDELILVNSFAAKAEVIEREGISIFIDDQPEVLKHIPSSVNVLLFRNEGNFDFEDRRWMLSDVTGKIV